MWHTIIHGALTGWLAAAAVDLHTFWKWTRWQDAAAFDWSTASFRWVVGAAFGALGAAGINVAGL